MLDQRMHKGSNARMNIEVLLIPFAYLLGSISSAIIVCRLMGLPDPRTQGSGNPGATNVLRLGGKKAAALTLSGDMLKGLIPILVAHGFTDSEIILALTGFTAFIGHLYPVFFGFRGGKGVATALGVQLGLHLWFGLSVAITWLIIAKGLKISSLAALISMSFAPIMLWFYWPSWPLVIMQILITLILLWRHRSNIQNLIQGSEGKISMDEPADDD